MKRISEALPDGVLSGAARLGINRQRVAQGKRPLARAHLPFNRRRPSFGQREIEEIANTARQQGLDRETCFQLGRYLWDVRRKEAAALEETFMLHFNAAYRRAQEIIWAAYDRGELQRPPRTCIHVYTAICEACAPRSAVSQLTRRDLAEQLRLSEREVSRHTAQLERLELLKTDQDGRRVTYLVLPVAELGYPLWHGDRIAMLDAAAEALEELERGRQTALAV